jgi:hypothetical protein
MNGSEQKTVLRLTRCSFLKHATVVYLCCLEGEYTVQQPHKRNNLLVISSLKYPRDFDVSFLKLLFSTGAIFFLIPIERL